MSKVYPPSNFSYVTDNLYRSSYPSDINKSFLSSLNPNGSLAILMLASVSNSEIESSTTSFTHHMSSIDTIEADLKASKCGSTSDFTLNNIHHQRKQQANEEQIHSIIAIIKSYAERGEPLLICCSSGKHVCNLAIGCVRKAMYGWALTSIFDEMRRFAGIQLIQEQFVEMFNE